MSEKDIGFCSGLKLGEVHILFKSYRIERKSKDKLKEYNYSTIESTYIEKRM